MGFELQVPGELGGHSSPQLSVTADNLNSAGGAVSVDIAEPGCGKGGKRSAANSASS